MGSSVGAFMTDVVHRNPGQPEFHQGVQEVFESLLPVLESTPAYRAMGILERLVEPERVVLFRVPWVDDSGQVRVNRGFHVEMSGAVGPFTGGLRFHPDVDLGVLKSLAFARVFQNSLTSLPLGGAMSAADFDPEGRSDGEVMRFCQAFMTELQRHAGPLTGVPTADIGVGERELGFLVAQLGKLTGQPAGGPIDRRGVDLQLEAAGSGAAYFAEEMLRHQGDSLEGKVCALSGSGRVARHALETVNALGGRGITLSDSDGTIVDEAGIDPEKLAFVRQLKERGGRIREYTDKYRGATYLQGRRPWGVRCDVALPGAREHELGPADARALVEGGCRVVCEGVRTPSVPEAVRIFSQARISHGPSIAAAAGGVVAPALEVASREDLDARLRDIIRTIHATCVEHGRGEEGRVNYTRGATIGAFIRLGDRLAAASI